MVGILGLVMLLAPTFVFVGMDDAIKDGGEFCGKAAGIEITVINDTQCPDIKALSASAKRLAKRMEVEPDIYEGWKMIFTDSLVFMGSRTVWGAVSLNANVGIIVRPPKKTPSAWAKYGGENKHWLHELGHIVLDESGYTRPTEFHNDVDFLIQISNDGATKPSLSENHPWRKFINGN